MTADASVERKLELSVHKRVLDNGLICVAVQTRAAPTLAISCSVEVSMMHEGSDKAGLALLLGSCLEEGTKRRTGNELAELVEGYGGYLSCSSNGATVQFAAEDVAVASGILAEVMLEPSLPADGLRRVKDLTFADISADLDDPRTVASQAYRNNVYGGHPFGRVAKGSVESVKSIERADLASFHATWFRPGNAVCAAVGAVDPQELLDLLEGDFSNWSGDQPPYPEADAPTRPDGARKQHIEMDKAQVQVFLGHPGITRFDKDFYALRVMDHILGSGPGFTSRISRKLRDEQGLCYAVGAGITSSASREPGMFTAYIGTSPGQEAQAIDGFLVEMRRIRDELCEPDELQAVQDYLTGAFVWALERNSNLAGFLIRKERFELGDDYLERLPRIIRAVTREEVREVANKHLDPECYHLVTLGPST